MTSYRTDKFKVGDQVVWASKFIDWIVEWGYPIRVYTVSRVQDYPGQFRSHGHTQAVWIDPDPRPLLERSLYVNHDMDGSFSGAYFELYERSAPNTDDWVPSL